MGICGSKNVEPDEQRDEFAVKNFLEGGSTLDELWSQFDSNGDGQIDEAEFENLVYTSLKHFCTQRNPDQAPPNKESMEPFIKKLVTQLQPYVDKDQDTKISKEEFRNYGTYLTNEFRKLRAELQSQSN